MWSVHTHIVQCHKQTNKQTNEQTNKQTNKRTLRSHFGSRLVHKQRFGGFLGGLGRCPVCLFGTRLCKLARAHNQLFVEKLIRNVVAHDTRVEIRFGRVACPLPPVAAAFVFLLLSAVVVAVATSWWAQWPCPGWAWPSPCAALVRFRARRVAGCLPFCLVSGSSVRLVLLRVLQQVGVGGW